MGRPKKDEKEKVIITRDIVKKKNNRIQKALKQPYNQELTPVAEKALTDFYEICALIESGYYSITAASNLVGRTERWIQQHVNNHPELKVQWDKAKLISKENSMGQMLKMAQEGMKKLIGGYETKETKNIYSTNPNNPDMTYLESKIETIKEVGPNPTAILETLKAVTPRYSKFNSVVVRQVLYELFIFLNNKGIDTVPALEQVQEFINIQEARNDE
jgi:hypothetical protein